MARRRRGEVMNGTGDKILVGDKMEKGEESSSQSKHLNNGRDPVQRCISKDLSSIVLLLVLYTLQGIPMGLSGSIPFLLQDKVTYSHQALFSLVSLPFSLKLVWAPLVDSVYYSPFGRRKSWLVPVQLICGIMMLAARGAMDDWVGEDGGEPHMNTLTLYFMVLYFIMATQDIAVDGWALTMLSHENVGYASMCNTMGQTIGFFISQVGFLALNNPEVCNTYLRSEPSDVGMVTLSSFLSFWGLMFLTTTAYVCFFKTEANESEDNVLGLVDTYKQLIKCVKLPSLQSLGVVLFTCRIAFGVTDAATSLKLVEYGMPKEKLVALSPLIVFLGIIIPVGLGRLTAGPMPLKVFIWGYPLRLVVTVVYAYVLPLARSAHMVPAEGVAVFYMWLVVAVTLHDLASNCMYVSQMAFFSRISDPSIGGTYMTLLNTVANIGTKWPNSLSLYLLDQLTVRTCLNEEVEVLMNDNCDNQDGDQGCIETDGVSCVISVDGYHIQVRHTNFGES
ncbi:unnamed protein product [Choristocarpus tenellus]